MLNLGEALYIMRMPIEYVTSIPVDVLLSVMLVGIVAMYKLRFTDFKDFILAPTVFVLPTGLVEVQSNRNLYIRLHLGVCVNICGDGQTIGNRLSGFSTFMPMDISRIIYPESLKDDS